MRLSLASFKRRDKTQLQQDVVQFVRAFGLWPCLFSDLVNRRLIERAEVRGRFRVQPPAAHHGLSAAFLERRVIKEGVRPRVENLHGQRRRLSQVARDQSLSALLALLYGRE